MPAKLKSDLMKEGKAKGLKGDKLDAYVYGTVNKLGLMKGNKETAKSKKASKSKPAKKKAKKRK